MDRERLDLIIDRQLRCAMAVTPSPDFNARVRGQIARERSPVVWFRPALAVSFIAAAAVMLAFLFKAPDSREAPATEAQRPIASTFAPSIAPAAPPVAPPVARRVVTKRRRAPEPEVIVPRGQEEAVQRFARSLSDMMAHGRPLPILGVVYEGPLPEVPSYDPKWSER